MDISVRVPETSIFHDTMPYIMAFIPQLQVRRRVWQRRRGREQEEIMEVLINIEHLPIKPENRDHIEDIIDKIFMHDIEPNTEKYHIYDINAFLRADLQMVFDYLLLPHDSYSILIDDRDLEAEMEERDLDIDASESDDEWRDWHDVMADKHYQDQLDRLDSESDD